MAEDNDSKVFWGLFIASGAHVIEEYFWPGGFLESAKEIAPEAFEHSSMPIIIGVNASMIIGAFLAALRRKRHPVEGLSMASLLFTNSLLHLGASIKAKKYVPGLVTGLVLYVPLSIAAFSSYRKSLQYKRSAAIRGALQGVALHSIPFVAFTIRGALEKRSGDSQ
jgi:Protein of unknown function with HXXEE motif